MQNKILFIVENDYFPRDARVYNEASSLSNNGYKVFVLAPRNNDKKEKFYETVEDRFYCFRHPHYESNSIKGLLFEYLIASIFYFFFVPVLVIARRIKIIHVANPPDFILPSFFWLKLFGVKFIYDIHDLSTETFKSKINKENIFAKIILIILKVLERISIGLSDIVITTNNSIKEIIMSKFPNKKVITIRNSNKIQFREISDINKNTNENLVLGYFGVLNDDYSSGYHNIALLGKILSDRNIKYKFEIIGEGSGLKKLKELLKEYKIEKNFNFKGFIKLPIAFDYIKNFDFGILPWPNVPKNNIHTAMKVMDYMCCGVPVCSLNLKEQLISTRGIGIHKETFEDIANEIIIIYGNKDVYEALREKTLKHFNENLCWELQQKKIIECYFNLTK